MCLFCSKTVQNPKILNQQVIQKKQKQKKAANPHILTIERKKDYRNLSNQILTTQLKLPLKYEWGGGESL